MAVRNFWITVGVDGRKTDVGTGPRAKDGGFCARIYIRDRGRVSKKYIMVDGVVSGNDLMLTAVLVNGNKYSKKRLVVKTKREETRKPRKG